MGTWAWTLVGWVYYIIWKLGYNNSRAHRIFIKLVLPNDRRYSPARPQPPPIVPKVEQAS